MLRDRDQIIQEIWGKRTNISIISLKMALKQKFKKCTILEIFPKPRNEMKIQLQEAFRTLKYTRSKISSSKHIVIKMSQIQNQDRILNTANKTMR